MNSKFYVLKCDFKSFLNTFCEIYPTIRYYDKPTLYKIFPIDLSLLGLS